MLKEAFIKSDSVVPNVFSYIILIIGSNFAEEWSIVTNPFEKSGGAVLIDSLNQRSKNLFLVK
jgi:hypothetical protein